MSEQDEDIGATLRRGGWRQGSTLTTTTLLELQDILPPGTTAAVVISQDCDLVRKQDVEPDVELLCGQVVDQPDNRFSQYRHPRIVHSLCENGSTHLQLDVRRRVFVEKIRLSSHVPDNNRVLPETTVRNLVDWVARRYTRPAFPDTFNERLRVAEGKLNKLLKHDSSRPVTAVYVALEDFDAELPAEEPYKVALWFSCRPESLLDERTRRQVYEFARRYVEILGDCPGISVIMDEVRSEDRITLSEIQVFRRFDYESRSLIPGREGDLPARVP